MRYVLARLQLPQDVADRSRRIVARVLIRNPQQRSIRKTCHYPVTDPLIDDRPDVVGGRASATARFIRKNARCRRRYAHRHVAVSMVRLAELVLQIRRTSSWAAQLSVAADILPTRRTQTFVGQPPPSCSRPDDLRATFPDARFGAVLSVPMRV